MSIEQTNQLILLILNSVLMTLLSSILLGGAWLRQNTLRHQLRKVRSHHRKIIHSASLSSDPNPLKNPVSRSHLAMHPAGLKQIRDRGEQLSKQYQWSRIGMLILHTTLLVFSVSLLSLTLRSLLAFDSLISAALVLFTLGAAGLLIGTGCILMDFTNSNTSDDSRRQTLTRLIQHVSRLWQRSSVELGIKAASRPTRSTGQSRALTARSPNKATSPSENAVS